MYDNLTACVNCQKELLTFASGIGVRQECNLSPTLFNLFVSDIADDLGNGQNKHYHPVRLSKLSLICLLYADDIILMSESEKGIQCCFDSLKTYCNQ